MVNQKGYGVGMGVLGLALAPQILGQVSQILNVKGTFNETVVYSLSMREKTDTKTRWWVVYPKKKTILFSKRWDSTFGCCWIGCSWFTDVEGDIWVIKKKKFF